MDEFVESMLDDTTSDTRPADTKSSLQHPPHSQFSAFMSCLHCMYINFKLVFLFVCIFMHNWLSMNHNTKKTDIIFFYNNKTD